VICTALSSLMKAATLQGHMCPSGPVEGLHPGGAALARLCWCGNQDVCACPAIVCCHACDCQVAASSWRDLSGCTTEVLERWTVPSLLQALALVLCERPPSLPLIWDGRAAVQVWQALCMPAKH
jgi:hypothetical protein